MPRVCKSPLPCWKIRRSLHRFSIRSCRLIAEGLRRATQRVYLAAKAKEHAISSVVCNEKISVTFERAENAASTSAFASFLFNYVNEGGKCDTEQARQ